MASEVLTFIVLGLVIGGIYALVAVGLTLLFGVLDVINVAHGEFMAAGGYLTYVLAVLLSLPLWVAFAGSVVGAFLISVLAYFVLIRPANRRLAGRAPGVVYLVLTLGLSTFMQNGMQAVFGPGYEDVPTFVGGHVQILSTIVTGQRLLIIVTAVVLLASLFAFLKFTREGMAVRAVSQNADAARTLGINLNRTYIFVFGASGLLAGTAGSLMSGIVKVYPTMGFLFAIKGFAVAIIGGLGDPIGALVASLLVGIAESLSVMIWSSDWRDFVAFAAMVLVLLVRPQGLFGRAKAAASDRL